VEGDHQQWCLELDNFVDHAGTKGLHGTHSQMHIVSSSANPLGLGTDSNSRNNSPATTPRSFSSPHAKASIADFSDKQPLFLGETKTNTKSADTGHNEGLRNDVASTAGAKARSAGLASPNPRALHSSVSRKHTGKALKINRAAVSEGTGIDASLMETALTVVVANYCAYLAYKYHTGSFTDSQISDSACVPLRSTPFPFFPAPFLALFDRLGFSALPALRLCASVFYILIGNLVIVTTLVLRNGRFLQANAEKLSAELRVTEQSVLLEAHAAAAMALSSSNNAADSTLRGSLQSDPSSHLNAGTAVDDPNIDNSMLEDDAQLILNGKPLPGNTLLRVNTPQRTSPVHSWSTIDHTEFNVRIGPNYSWNKKKAPSASPLYECFAVDVFSAAARIDHAAERFAIPKKYTDVDTHSAFVPPVFVVQIQIPADSPSFFSSVTDGPGWSICMFFAITPQTLSEMKNLATASPAVRLWAKWCEVAEQDKAWRSRFKFIASCSNLIELGVPSSIAQWNAKPILIRRTGTLYRGEASKYMEFDVHIHKFDNLAKKSIHYMTAMCAKMLMQIGFVIEGRDDAELPEALFGACAINCPQESQSEFMFDE